MWRRWVRVVRWALAMVRRVSAVRMMKGRPIQRRVSRPEAMTRGVRVSAAVLWEMRRKR